MTLRARLSERCVVPTKDVGNAQRRWRERRSAIYELADAAGNRGWGEAAPLPGYSHDTLESASAALARLEPASFPSLAESSFPEISVWIDRAIPAQEPAARFACETAFLDLAARKRGVPLHALLRAGCAELRERELGELELAALVDVLGEVPLEQSARKKLARGFGTLKAKLGADQAFERELGALQRLREECGFDFRLRLDVNQGWSLEQAREYLPRLQTLRIEFVEEPIAAPSVERFSWLASPVPLAADEWLATAAGFDWAAAARVGVAAAVLKPTLLGGMLRCVELALCARSRAMFVVVSHTFEGAIGYAACCELALALGETQSAQGLGPHAVLDASAVRSPLALRGARLVPHAGPGLGCDFDEPRVR